MIASPPPPVHVRPSDKTLGLACILGLALFVSAAAYAQEYEGILVLEQIPSNVAEGETVTFSGYLSTGGGAPVSLATVYIKDDVSFGSDNVIGVLTTDSDGRFAGAWEAQARSDGAWDFYAVFEGSSQVEEARSVTYSVRVSPYEELGARQHAGEITLDQIPSTAVTGEAVVFSGYLTTDDGYIVPGATVYIKDDVDFGSDDIIMTLTTDDGGEFYGTWEAQTRGEGAWDFYAVFEGSSQVEEARSVTYSVRVSPYEELGARQHAGEITLDQIPSTAVTGEAVVFSGYLTTGGGAAVTGATVHIKDDVDLGSDDVVMTLATDDEGRFSGAWDARPRGEGAWDFYAVFEGSSQVGEARSETRSVRVSSYASDQAGSPPSGQYRTQLTLDPVSGASAGDIVVFTGRLTADGQPLSGAPVSIYEDDPLSPDQRLGSGTTDSEGGFSIEWRVTAGLLETDFDIYAKFDGDAVYEGSRTENQTAAITKISGRITLDPIPDDARVGETVTFSGTLRLDGHSAQGAVVYIKDEDPGSGDELLATAYVEGDGRFSADWFANRTDPDDDVDVYAVFEGNDDFYRLTTCDVGPTSSVGGLCADTIPLTIYGSVPTPLTSGYVVSEDQYMELFYALDFESSPRVAIVPDPDSYQEARGHVIPAKEGVSMWKSYMEGTYGGDWDVTFEVVEPGAGFYDAKPDIVMNLVTSETDQRCGVDYQGFALISPEPTKPIQTTVCSTDGGQRLSNDDVAATAAHEFIHAVGLGHAFNKSGDLLCSVEEGKPTCGGSGSESKIPSGLNLASVAQIYGSDGFKNPNRYVDYKERFPKLDQGAFVETAPISEMTKSPTESGPAEDPVFEEFAIEAAPAGSGLAEDPVFEEFAIEAAPAETRQAPAEAESGPAEDPVFEESGSETAPAGSGPDPAPAESESAGQGGGCLMATAAYGTEAAGQVQALREVRDRTVMSTGSGAAFMSAFNAAYYAVSPGVADLQRQSPEFNQAVRALLAPALLSASVMHAAEPGSEASVAAHGTAAILLAAGAYAAAPAAVLACVRARRG